MKNKEELKSIIILASIIVVAIVITIFNFDKDTSDDTSYSKETSYLHNYGINEVIYSTVSESDMASKYLVDFVNLTIFDKKEAYNKVDEYYKQQKVKTYSDFENLLKEKFQSVKFLSAKVESYSITSNGKNKLYYIIDSDNNKFVIKEKSIMDYTIYLDTYNVDK